MASDMSSMLGFDNTKDPFSVHNYKEAVVLFLLIVSGLYVLLKSPLPYQVNVVLAGLLVMGGFFGFRYMDQNHYKLLLYQKSIKNTSFFDPKMNQFLNVKNVSNDVILSKKNELTGILHVKPQDGSILEKDEAVSITETFGELFRSIPQDIHFFSHSVDPNIDDFFTSQEQSILENNKVDPEEAIKATRYRQKFFLERAKKTNARDRVSYFTVIQESKFVQKKIEKNKDKKSDQYIAESYLREINASLDIGSDLLEKTSLEVNRMVHDNLISIYPAYFYKINRVGRSNLNRVMWHELDDL